MLISLAWKNVWRNKKRSLIILTAIAFGLWGGLMSGSIMMGMGESMVETAINRDLAHIQIHNKNFVKENKISNFIPNGFEVIENARSIEGVKAVSGRTIIEGMAASPTSSYGVKIVGIEPQQARQVTDISKKIIAGSYFESKRKNQIIIGKKLAKRLNLKLRSKMVLSLQDLDGSIIYTACRVVGIFKTESSLFDDMNVFVRQKDLFKELNIDPIVHEIAIRLKSAQILQVTDEIIKAKFNHCIVRTWKELAPEVAFLSIMMQQFTYLFVAIILFALLFGITNTMLMSVMDRVRELGVLIAVGMKKRKVFTMILLETIFLSITGGFGGILIGGLTIAYFSSAGIDLSAFATSLENFGSSSILYPFLPFVMYIILTIMIVIAANVAAIYPALKAIRLQPSEAIRTY